MDEASRELKGRIRDLSNEQLLEMVTLGAADYLPEALAYAHAEVAARGLDISQASGETEEPAPAPAQGEDSTALDAKGLVCLSCGGQMLSGTLVAEKEMTIIFDASRQERFVRAFACRQCGHLSLVVDLQTDVQL